MHDGLIILDSHAFNTIYGQEHLEAISGRVRLLAGPMTSREAAQRPDLLAQADVIFSGWGAPKMDAAFLATAARLKAVFYGAGTIRYFTSDEFWARDIVVSSAYAMNAVPVAEYTLATILLSLKNYWYHAVEIKRLGRFTERIPCAGAYGSKVGLVSLGMIGRLVRERLRPFDLEVLAYDPHVTPDEADRLGVELVSLEDIFSQCDVVSLHTPWLKETEGMIQGRHFELMKPRSTFINTARGAVVREAEMCEVLQRRPDLTALLDVVWPEPPAQGSPLFSLPNVILTPHIAGSRDHECRRMGRLMIEEFDRWNRGEALQWAISEKKALTLA
ncbi:MAG: hydroxyacid dehydrogenase [Opitutaceae bacterium]|jgi:phosphoglycerate dehydrogenase-like enzyme